MANVKKIVGYRIGDFRTEDGNDIHFINLFAFLLRTVLLGYSLKNLKSILMKSLKV